MDGDIFGPYSAKEILSLDLLPNIMVSEASMDSWLPASEFDFADIARKELLEKLQAKPTNENVSGLDVRKEELKIKLQNNGNIALQNCQCNVQENIHIQSFPQEITYNANFNEGLNSIGGKLIITPAQFVFHPHKVNFGDLSDRVFNISDIVGYEKGFLSFMYIKLKDGRKIKLTVWDKQGIINELEARRTSLNKI